MSALYIIRGIPGSGKSTLAKTMHHAFEAQGLSSIWCETDQYFMSLDGEYLWDKNKLHEAHEWCQNMVWDALKNDHTVIVSNTFTTKKELQPYFDMAHQLGFNPTVIYMQSNFGSVHGVPEASLTAMRNRFAHNIDDMFKVFEK